MKGRACSIAGCHRPHAAKGLCATHYARKKRGGTTELRPLVINFSGIAAADLAYVAGFIDADGTITVERTRSNDRGTNDGIRHIPKVWAGSVDLAPLEMMVGLFGGRIAERKPQAISTLRFYTWKCSGPRAVELASALLPYLRIKRPQAECLVAFRDSDVWSRSRVGSSMPATEFARREALAQRTGFFNQRRYLERLAPVGARQH